MPKKNAGRSGGSEATSISQCGWSVARWCADTSIGRSTFYVLPRELAPRSTKLGRRVIVIESPAAWLDRIHRTGGLPKLRNAA